MAAKQSYTVNRHHLGDKPYAPGDKRELEQHEAARLVELGILTEAKAEKAPSNKALKAAPENK